MKPPSPHRSMCQPTGYAGRAKSMSVCVDAKGSVARFSGCQFAVSIAPLLQVNVFPPLLPSSITHAWPHYPIIMRTTCLTKSPPTEGGSDSPHSLDATWHASGLYSSGSGWAGGVCGLMCWLYIVEPLFPPEPADYLFLCKQHCILTGPYGQHKTWLTSLFCVFTPNKGCFMTLTTTGRKTLWTPNTFYFQRSDGTPLVCVLSLWKVPNRGFKQEVSGHPDRAHI